MAGIEEKLKTESGFSSYVEIVQWLKKEYDIDAEYGTVYSLVRYHLGAKLKVSRPQSSKQDEKLVSEFKKNLVQS